LGDYAFNMPFSVIELRDRASIPNDLAALLNRRFVIASETSEVRLNTPRVKAITGCDPVTARFLHQEFFTFVPVGKFWLCGNHKPVIKDDSPGFWRRIRLIPFTQRFGLNPDLQRTLRDEGPGILAWMVRGCLAWQQHGLKPPAAVADATQAYERDSDDLADFMEAAVELEPDSQVMASELYEHYDRWAKAQGLSERERLSSTQFGRRISERLRARRLHGRKWYLGVARKEWEP
jgi:putative DNA primase/helicase